MSEPQPLDLDALETVALAAAEHLPGEWRINTDEDAPSTVAFLDHHAGDSRWLAFAHCSGGCLEWVSASDHIATFDPPTVLRLVEEQKALRVALKELWLRTTCGTEAERVAALSGAGDLLARLGALSVEGKAGG